MSDVIYRQDAIDAICEACYIGEEASHTECKEYQNLDSTWCEEIVALRNVPSAEPRKKGKWILDENPHDGDCRCSVCLMAIDQMHERNHGLLNALTGGKWWTFYKYCPNCGAKMEGV